MHGKGKGRQKKEKKEKQVSPLLAETRIFVFGEFLCTTPAHQTPEPMQSKAVQVDFFTRHQPPPRAVARAVGRAGCAGGHRIVPCHRTYLRQQPLGLRQPECPHERSVHAQCG